MSLMYLIPNHKCPSKDCPFHASEVNDRKKKFESPATEDLSMPGSSEGLVEGGKLMKGPKRKLRTSWKVEDREEEEEIQESATESANEDNITEVSIDTGNETTSECDTKVTFEGVVSEKTDGHSDVQTEFHADTGIESLASDDVHLDDIEEEQEIKLESIEELEIPVEEQKGEFDVDNIKEEIVFAGEPEILKPVEAELTLKTEESIEAPEVRVNHEIQEVTKMEKHETETQVLTVSTAEEQVHTETIVETNVTLERLKNGEEIELTPRHKATYKDGVATLDIKALEPEDGATYTCRASNSFGDTETSADLKIEEVYHRRKKRPEEAAATVSLPQQEPDTKTVDTEVPPEFTLPLISQVAPVGDNVELSVTVKSQGEPHIEFYRGNDKVAVEGRFQLLQDEDTYSLTISDLQPEDAGEWRCLASNKYGRTWCSCDIRVLESIPEGSAKPVFLQELEPMTITEGSRVQLQIRVRGTPEPNIEWYKDRQRLDTSRHYKILKEDEGVYILEIDGATKEDSGSYMCRAINEAGSASTEARIRVQKVSEVEISREDMAPAAAVPTKQYRFQMAPDFTVKLRNKTVMENNHVRLTCSVTGIPEPTSKWYKDGEDITNKTRYSIMNNYGLLSLEILRTEVSDSGCYTCEASNCEGTVTCSASLDVQSMKRISPDTVERPRFLNPLGDICIREGEDAVFECVATGKPAPAFKWQKDVREVSSSSRIIIESDDEGKAHLTVKNVRRTDSGLYVCIAYSDAGRCKCSGSLRVIEKSPSPMTLARRNQKTYASDRVFDPLHHITEPGRPPFFSIMLPREVEVIAGQRLRLDCAVEGFPTPVVTWHKNVRELSYGERHRIMMCATLHTMEIGSVMTLDAGEYIVRATNVFGSVETSTIVRVKDRDPESDSYVEPVITPRDGVPVELRRAPFFIKPLPPRIDVIEGTDVQLDCILRDGIDLVRYSDEDTDKPQGDLEEHGFVGGYADMGRLTAPSGPQIKKGPPEFVKKLTDVRTTVDSLVTLVTTVIDDPVADITWFKDDKKIPHGDKYEIFFEKGSHHLEIYDTDVGDSGTYKCVAVNVLGSADCQCTVTIEDIQEPEVTTAPPADDSGKEPPHFTNTPSDLTLPAGAEAVFDCTVAGTPLPDVAWFKDGKQVTPNDCLRIVADGNTHQLRISAIVKSDEGQYIATATSEAGTRSCAARLTIQVLTAAVSSTEVSKKKEEKPAVASKFTSPLPPEVTASKGDNVSLSCEISEGVSTVHWEHNGKKVNKSSQAVMTSDPSGTHILEVRNIIKSNAGSYTCVAKMTDGSVVKTDTKLVLEEEQDIDPSMNKPKFVTTLMDLSCKDGDTVTLECQVRGEPRPQITWFRDGDEIPDTQDFMMSMIGNTCKLCIAEVYPEDEGRYVCKAVNSQGETTTACMLFVEGGTRNRDGTNGAVEFRIDLNNRVGGSDATVEKTKPGTTEVEFAPEFGVKPRRQFVDEGQPAKFKVSCEGLPRPEVTWYKNEKQLQNDSRIKIYEEDDYNFLEINDVTAKDKGMYSCKLSNKLGKVEASTELSVFQKSTNVSKKPTGPSVISHLENLTTTEGEKRFILDCSFADATDCSVAWFKDGEEIKPGREFRARFDGRVASLTISRVLEEDIGKYECVVTGPNGEARTNCTLKVEVSNEKREPPVFVRELRDMEVDNGDKVELVVEVKDNDQPGSPESESS